MAGATLLDEAAHDEHRQPREPPPLAGAPVRVLMVVRRLQGRNGMQQQARRVGARLRERGVPVRFVTRGPVPGTPAAHTLRVTGLPPGEARFHAGLFCHLVRTAPTYDLAHVHGFEAEVLVALAARAVTRRPVVVKPATSGAGTRLHRYARLARACPPARALWRRVDAWVCISEMVAADVRMLGAPPQRLFMVPNGLSPAFRPLPPEERAKLRRELGLAEGDVLACTTSRLSPHKGVADAVGAFLSLAARFPRARLWVMGAGESAREIERMCRGAPEGDRVRLWGRVPPALVRRHLQAADLFLLPSLWEGLSNALLEAMACGAAPIASAVSGSADVVRAGYNGLLVPPGDTAALTESLALMLREPLRLQAMRSAAAATACGEYSIDRTVDGLLAVYDHSRRWKGDARGR